LALGTRFGERLLWTQRQDRCPPAPARFFSLPPDAAHGETSSGHLGMEETQPEGAGLAMLTLSFFGSALKRVERREVSATVGRPAGGGSV